MKTGYFGRLAAIVFNVIFRPFVMVQIWPIFDMMFSRHNTSEKSKEMISCNFLGVNQHIDPTTRRNFSYNFSILARTVWPEMNFLCFA